MEIIINNCNNIDNGIITIKSKTLNIKYGINGTGKTTISRAIKYALAPDENESLSNLRPFKHIGSVNLDHIPAVKGFENIKKVAIFNESYINKYAFVEDEILKGSFEIFFKDEAYIDSEESIKQITSLVNKAIDNSEDIKILLENLEELRKCFGVSNKSIAKNSSLHKGYGALHSILNVPEKLKSFEPFIQDLNKNTTWLKWQFDGHKYNNHKDTCPFCSSNISSKQEIIQEVKNTYDKTRIDNLYKILQPVESLKEYLSQDTYMTLKDICQSVTGIDDIQQAALLRIKQETEDFIKQLKTLQSFNKNNINSIVDIEGVIKSLKINPHYYTNFNTDKVNEHADNINATIDEVLQHIGTLKGKINMQRKRLQQSIEVNKTDINSFLKSAGYPYIVDTLEQNGETRMILKHIDVEDQHIENAKTHLSFGEKNAFALILFMYEAIKTKTDLIVLDDPISSFDKNKKYAIINRLFKEKNSFRDRTVLMLTHDFDPIVDMLSNVKEQFKAIETNAHFLENISGNLTEHVIKTENIQTFHEIAKENIQEIPNKINKLIYLRRLCEIEGNKSAIYQLLSNLFHKGREIPLQKGRNNDFVPMIEEDVQDAIAQIKEIISEFSTYEEEYDNIHNKASLIDQYKSADSNYEKLQLFRLLIDKDIETGIEKKTEEVVMKFINETYHLENDYLYQLNPRKYSTIPQYIIDICDSIIEKMPLAA